MEKTTFDTSGQSVQTSPAGLFHICLSF